MDKAVSYKVIESPGVRQRDGPENPIRHRKMPGSQCRVSNKYLY